MHWYRLFIAGVLLVAGCRTQPEAAMLGTPPPDKPPLFEVVTEGPVALDVGRSRGAAWGDYDGDGDPDLFVTHVAYDSSAPLPANVLYRNEGAGRFVRIDAPPSTREGDSEAAVWVDVDNDGDLDLHVVGRSGVGSILFENVGAGRFVRLSDGPLGHRVQRASMACWADVDGDGLLDVLTVGYRTDRNRLFRNRGHWRFDSVSLPAPAAGAGEGRACAWGDLDGDGLPELVIANARAPNLLLRNRGRFQLAMDTTTPLQRDTAYGYGVSWTDVNGDGLRDLFVANFDAGNSLYLGGPDGSLARVDLGETLQSAASKGHAWGDFDLDGRIDLYVGSGTPGPRMFNRLYLEQPDGSFLLFEEGAFASHADTSAAVAAADYDLDGDLDLFVANWGSLGSVNRLYRNMAAPSNWLKVELEGVRSNRMGIGARVTALISSPGEARELDRWLDAATGYAGQNEPVLHFGLGEAQRVDSLIVAWPSGTVDRFGPVSAGSTLRVREGGGSRRPSGAPFDHPGPPP